MNQDRSGIRWKIRYFLGYICQGIVWRLQDPWDTWMIEYHMNGCQETVFHEGFFSSAKLRCRELGGKITGYNITEVPADDDEEAEDLYA